MKRIGILTMHRVQNYGSALQAYALQEYVNRLGYDAELIDYIFPNDSHKHHRPFRKRIKSALFKWAFYFPLLRKSKRFARFYEGYYNCSQQQFASPDSLAKFAYPYDVLVTGSDQVWNPIHVLTDTSFFLSFGQPHTPKIAYAPSFSLASVTADFAMVIRSFLESYRHLSVREKSGLNIVKGLIGKEVEMVCDPTLLLTKEEWGVLAEQSSIRIDEPYILVYVLSYAYNPYPEISAIIEQVQKELNMPLILLDAPILDMKFNNARFIKDAGPLEFLYLVQHASFVITTSFHGTAFALNFGIPFYSVIRDHSGFDTRMMDLIDVVGADRAIVYNKPIDRPLEMNYSIVSERIEFLRSRSQEYLKRSLGESVVFADNTCSSL
ncbi:MAG: polysaccharide pyruvyl transferase family protein [Bacteroidaceae bacterium]|nr:polysaccharide pyruvyl transferase family protein [Bacteroidaceae bacterium]